MSRWWRAYDEAVDDPKLILLSDKAHRAWFCLMCVASANGGMLPDIKIVAVKLRTTAQRAAALLAELVSAGLFDRREDGKFEPHNWSSRQYKSDGDPTNATRQKRYRHRKRNGSNGVTDNVTVTLSREQRQRTETDIPEANASGADAPADAVDHRKRLFSEGLPKIAAMTGRGPDACRSFLGKCLKSAGDDAVVVIGLIEEAERNQVVDPTAWIAARLKTRENSANGRRTVQQAADDLLANIRAFNEPAPSGICDATGETPVRLLPSR